MAIVIDTISPVAFSVFGIDIRWYALAYIAAFVVGYVLLRRFTSRPDSVIKLSKQNLDDLLTAVVFGVIIGGRLGYVLFYNLSYFISHPLEILAVWHGGMSFHGGLLGVIVATILFARRHRINALSILDLMAVVAPLGLFFGRIANFINRANDTVESYNKYLVLETKNEDTDKINQQIAQLNEKIKEYTAIYDSKNSENTQKVQEEVQQIEENNQEQSQEEQPQE